MKTLVDQILIHEKSYQIIQSTEDDISQIRKLVNLAYKELADLGLNYTAVDQDESKTADRISKGRCFILKNNEQIIATILVSVSNYFTNKNTLYVSQFGVHPNFKRQGLGKFLMDYCECLAFNEGFSGVQLDTAIPATHLVDWYIRIGYIIVGTQHWEGKTYDSYVFEKRF